MRVIVAIVLLSLVGRGLAAYATNTNNLYSSLDTCYNDVAGDIECVENVRDGLQKMSDYIQDIRDLKDDMKKINDGMNTFNSVLGIAKYAPGIGTAVTVLKNTLNAIRPTFNAAYNKVKQIDAKIYPYKAKCDTGVTHCETAIFYMEIMKTKCEDGRDGVGTARTCINSMVSGSLRTTLQNNLEDLGGALHPPFNTANQALGVVGSGCDSIKQLTNIALSWPDISFIISGLDDVYDALKPILDFFDGLQNALNAQLCIPNPFEAIAEWELLEEAAEAFNPGNWGWGRRKRSLAISNLRADAPKTVAEKSVAQKRAVITVTRAQASSLLAMSKGISKRGSICLSAQDILDGVDALLAPLVDLANSLINELLKALPSFDLPGFPNFDNLFNININFNLPDISFGFDTNDYVDFIWLNWNCATQVGNACRVISGGVSVNCASSLDDYAPNWGGWGRKRRSIAAKSTDQVELMQLIDMLQHNGEKRGEEKKRTVENATVTVEEATNVQSSLEVSIEVQSGGHGPRQDDKDLTSEQAEQIVQNMTEEQRNRLRARLRCGHEGCSSATTAAPGSAPSHSQSSKHEMMVNILETLRHAVGQGRSTD